MINYVPHFYYVLAKLVARQKLIKNFYGVLHSRPIFFLCGETVCHDQNGQRMPE